MLPTRSAFLAVIAFILLCVTTDSFSQFYVGRIDAYAVTTFTESYSNLSGSNLGTGDDNVYTTTLPFNFNYDNTLFPAGTTVYISTNGFVKFGGTNPGSGCCGNILGSSTYGPGPVIFSYDMVVEGGIYVEQSGSAPNRVLSIEWKTTRRYSGNIGYTDWKMRLYETNNYIDFLYKDLNFNMGSGAMGVGLNGTTSPSFIAVTAASPGTYTPSNNYRFKTPAPNVQLFATPESMDFGSQLTGQATQGIVNVTHAGTEQSLVISNAAISGANAADYTIISGPAIGTTLSPGQSVTYTLQFVPSFGGTRNALFTVVTNGRDSGTQATTLTGFGVAPKIQVTPTELFKRSKVLVNDTLEQSIVISSIGAANLFFTNYPNGSFTFSGDNPGDYVISRMPQNPLPAGGSDTLKVKFIPKAEG
ncbi:MAG TPA: choice-of-anchor D domain-containing protein, partial [Candidatus Kapabacteria bacterium]